MWDTSTGWGLSVEHVCGCRCDHRHIGGVEGATQVPMDVEYGSLDFSVTQVGA